MTAPDPQDMWLSRARRTRAGDFVVEYLRLSDAGAVPQGVGLYASRKAAKDATKFRLRSASRTVPADLEPAAVTAAAGAEEVGT